MQTVGEEHQGRGMAGPSVVGIVAAGNLCSALHLDGAPLTADMPATPGVPSSEQTRPEHMRIGEWDVDPAADEIARGGAVVKLEPLNMRLLLALAARPGEVVPTQELLDSVWSGVVVTPASVYQAVAQLRRRLGDEAESPAYIQTIPRKGYRLVAPVMREAAAQLTAAGAQPETAPAPTDRLSTTAGNIAQSAAGQPSVTRVPIGRRRQVLALAAAAALGAVAGGGLWLNRSQLGVTSATLLRIVVLPFEDLGRNVSDQPLSEGLALDVGRALGRHKGLDVIAPDSSLRAQALQLALPELARRLAVGFVLVGDLARAGLQLRLGVRLLDTSRDQLIWQSTFEQPLAALARLPEEVAAKVAATLGVAAIEPAKSPRSAEAYELYVLGANAWRSRTPEGYQRARDFFERGVALDPEYARNYLGLGWTWLGRVTNDAGVEYQEAYARATPLFEKAARLDPESEESLTALAVLESSAGRYDSARERFGQAIGINPSYAQAHHSLGVLEYEAGWPQRAAVHFQRAAELNPLSIAPLDRLGLAQLSAGRFEEAQAAFRSIVDLDPKHPNGYWGFGMLGYARGDLVAAVTSYREALVRERRRPYLWHELGWLYLDLRMRPEAERAFAVVAELLPQAVWPRAAVAFALLGDAARSRVEAFDMSITGDDWSSIDALLVRAMGGLPVDVKRLQATLAAMQARSEKLAPAAWQVFQGRQRLLDIAALFQQAHMPESAIPYLKEAEAALDTLMRQGNAWHSLYFHRGRLQAMLSNATAALDDLERAHQLGSRRGWWLELDPALRSLRGNQRFTALLAKHQEHAAAQQQQLTQRT